MHTLSRAEAPTRRRDLTGSVGLCVSAPCSGEARSTVLAFWHAFVEPFFGRGQRQYSPLHTKTQMQQLEAEEHVEKQSSSSDEQEEPKGKAGMAGLQLPWLVYASTPPKCSRAAAYNKQHPCVQITCHLREDSIPFG